MARFVVLIAIITLISAATIPPTMINTECHQIDLTVAMSFPAAMSATYSQPYTSLPSVAVLLNNLVFQNRLPSQNYFIVAGVPRVNKIILQVSSNIPFGSVKLCWVAAAGDHLQFFPINLTLNSDYLTQNTVFDIPFDYPNLVQWRPGTFQVAITSVISSFYLTSDTNDYRVDMTIAKWNGTAYDYSGDTRYILDNNALYGTNCPFTSSGGVNVVKMWAGGFSGTTINSYLLLHKVQLTGAINTGIGIIRTHAYDSVTGASLSDISDPSYNVAMTDPATIRLFGFESFSFGVSNDYTNILTIETSDGVTGSVLHDTESGSAYIRAYFGNYLTTRTFCPSGCVCPDGATCPSCMTNAHRVTALVPTDGLTTPCPCANGYYQDTDLTCKQCPRENKCLDCQLNPDDGSIQCLSCKCRNHRMLNHAGQCICASGFQEATPAGSYCVRTEL